MPWNEPGNNSKSNNPWGERKEQGPPDLDKIIGEFIGKMRSLFTKGKQSGNQWQQQQQPTIKTEGKYIVGFILVAVFIIWFLSGLFIVNPAEQTVVLRFGKYEDVLQPGMHWIARFIDTKYTVDVQKIYSFSLDDDYLTKSAEQNDLPNTYIETVAGAKVADISDQSKNLVNVELTVQYRINDPRDYLYNVVDPDQTIKEAASGALSDVVGQMKLDEVLTTGREMLSSSVLERTKQILLPYHSGIEVVKITLRKVQAPDQVRAAFNDVNRADQDKATYIQQALAYASKVVPLAQGAAARTLADATGYQKQIVLTAQANVANYQALLKAYSLSPDITRERMYIETMQTVLQSTSKVLIEGNNNVMYLPLDKLLKPTTAATSDDLENTMSQSVDQGKKNDTN